MSGNKQFVKTRAQPPSHVAVAMLRVAQVISYGTFRTHGTQRVDTMPSAANIGNFRHFPTSLAPSFSDTRDSLNFLSVHSCSQNLRLISCMSVVCIEVSMKTNAVRLNFYHWCKTSSSAFSKKISDDLHFLHVFGRALNDLQLCSVQLKTLAPSARYSTCKYPVTLKPG